MQLTERENGAVPYRIHLRNSDSSKTPQDSPARSIASDISARAAALEDSVEAPVSRSALAGAVLGELRRATDHGPLPLPESVLAALNLRDVFSNQRVRTEQEGAGIARGILESGALLLERDDGSRVGVVAGSVTLA